MKTSSKKIIEPHFPEAKQLGRSAPVVSADVQPSTAPSKDEWKQLVEHGLGAQPERVDPNATAQVADARSGTLWSAGGAEQQALERFSAHLTGPNAFFASDVQLRIPNWPQPELVELAKGLLTRNDPAAYADALLVAAALVRNIDRRGDDPAPARDLAQQVLSAAGTVAGQVTGGSGAIHSLTAARQLLDALLRSANRDDALIASADRLVLGYLPAQLEADLTRAEASMSDPAGKVVAHDLSHYWSPVVRGGGRVETDDLHFAVDRARHSAPELVAGLQGVFEAAAARLYALDEQITPTPSQLPLAERWSLLSMKPDSSPQRVEAALAQLEGAISRGEARFARQLVDTLVAVWAPARAVLELAAQLQESNAPVPASLQSLVETELPPGVTVEQASRLSARLEALGPKLAALRG